MRLLNRSLRAAHADTSWTELTSGTNIWLISMSPAGMCLPAQTKLGGKNLTPLLS